MINHRSHQERTKKNRLPKSKDGKIILEEGGIINWDAGFELQFGFTYPIIINRSGINTSDVSHTIYRGNTKKPRMPS